MSKDSNLLLKEISGKLKKKFIDVISLSDPDVGSLVKHRIPSSSRMINYILGGGVPCGRVTEIFGEESNGKSSLVADIMAETQRLGGLAIIIDSEQAFSPERAEAMGVKVEDVVYSNVESVEDAFEVMQAVAEEMSGVDQYVLIVWDSVAASSTKAELDTDMEAHAMASKARLLSKGMRKLIGKIGPKTAIVFTNQVRTKFGITFGKNTEAAGGFALRYATSVRIELQKIGQLKDKEKPIGIRCRATTSKSKIVAPFKKAEFDMYFAGGIDDTNALLDKLVLCNSVQQSGSWYQCELFEKKFMRKDFKENLNTLPVEKIEELYKLAMES